MGIDRLLAFRKTKKEGRLRGEHGSLPEIPPATAGVMTSAEVIGIKEGEFK